MPEQNKNKAKQKQECTIESLVQGDGEKRESKHIETLGDKQKALEGH